MRLQTTSVCWGFLFLGLAGLGLCPSPGRAYIDDLPPEKLTLPQLILEFRSIQVLQIDQLDLARGAVLFKSAERIQGREDAAVLKHSVKFGAKGVPAELKGLKPGQPAILFSGDGYKRTITLVEGAWYCSSHDTRSGWSHIAYTAGHYDFNCAFTGTVSELKETIRQLLRGEEVVMRCRKKARQPETQFVRCSLRLPSKKEVVPEPKGAARLKIVTPEKAPLAALVHRLQGASMAGRVEAAEALAGQGASAKEATAALAAAIRQDKDPFVRRAAAVALGSIGSEARAAVPDLLVALQSHYENVDGLVGSECAVALGKIDPDGTDLAPLLTANLKDPSPDTRMRAANWAAIIGPPARSVTAALIEATRDKSGAVRHSATAALGSIRPDVKVAVPVFIAALKDPNEFVRMAAARALAEIGPEAQDAIPALRAATKDGNGEVRQYAEQALKQVIAP
jgi:hypothetical protein